MLEIFVFSNTFSVMSGYFQLTMIESLRARENFTRRVFSVNAGLNYWI